MEYRYKHIVVVHGIGDQARNETALGFVNELIRALPRGNDYEVEVGNLIEDVDYMLGTGPGSGTEKQERAFRPSQFHFRNRKEDTEFIVGFSEVYWQDITDRHLKDHENRLPLPLFSWAHSINTRFLKDPEKYALAMEAIDNLERLLGMVSRLATYHKQSARFTEITNKFLGDVQMYTESDTLRREINRHFVSVMERVEQFSKKTREDHHIGELEIYIVAHSEGTVVAYNSLVEAMEFACKVLMEPGREYEEGRWLMAFSTGDGTNIADSKVEQQQRLDKQKECAENIMRWFRQIKGLVTLGSPLDKHYTIWSNRFRVDCLKDVPLESLRELQAIPWFNYWDQSDPVGYGLNELFEPDESKDSSREPSDAKKLFCRKYDSGYSRYPIPGVAHVDYWKDQGIYQNVIHEVMGLAPGKSKTVASKQWTLALHALDLPLYLLVRLATLGVGVFFLYKLLRPARHVLDGLRDGSVLQGVAGVVSFDLTTGAKLSYAISVIGPLLVLKGLRRGYRKAQGEFQNGLQNVYRLLSGVWVVWVVYLCVVVGEGATVDFKDWVGYGMGLATTAFVWMLHSRVHLGLLQMWRYTKGADTGLKVE